jgi:Na+-driven multidrug efflux pump
MHTLGVFMFFIGCGVGLAIAALVSCAWVRNWLWEKKQEKHAKHM